MINYPIEKDGLIIQRCVCKRIKVIDENGNISFEKMDVPENRVISHTYCEKKCYEDWVSREEVKVNGGNLEIIG